MRRCCQIFSLLKVLYDENGIPLGSNGAMTTKFSQLFDFELNLIVYSWSGTFNTTTGQWTGAYYDVNYFILFANSENWHKSFFRADMF